MVNWAYCGSVQIVTARKCNMKHHLQLYSRLVLPPYTIKIREDTWEELPRWAVVLPPNTVKIRGRCSIFLTIVKLVSCHPMQLRQGEDARPSVKLMPTTPWSQDKGRMLHLLSWRRGSPFVDYKASHISEPLFPGGTSVFRVHTILTLPNLPRCSMIAASSTKYKNELDPKHDWLCSP